MRLTLRTLLAYLDDILEPAEAKEIGTKIAESSYASSLVSKVKDVVRRRRISAPEVSGPGSTPDPNVVAEYLDNTLAPDSVADLERVCLESDMHLAEVAACHQVLTLVRSEPVEIPAGMRDRMYALGAVAPTQANGGNANGSGHVPRLQGIAADDVPRNTRPSSAEATLRDRLPEALQPKRKSRLRRALPYLIGLVVVGLWAYLTFNDPALMRVFRPAPDSVADSGAGEVDLSRREKQRQILDGASEPIDIGTAGESEQVASIPEAAVAAPDLTLTPSATVEEGQSIAATQSVPPLTLAPEPDSADPTTVDSVAVTPAPELTPAPDVFEPPAEQPPAQPPLPEPWSVQDASSSGVLLHLDESTDDWFVLRPRSIIHPQEKVAVPRPFDATFTVGDSGEIAEVILRGGTLVKSLGSTVDGRFGFEIQQGQLVVRRKDTAPAEEPVSMQIVVRADTYAVDLLEPDTVMGIEVIPVQPKDEGDLRGGSEYDGGIVVIAGAAVVTPRDSEPVELRPAAGLLTFSSTVDAPPAQAEPLLSLPNWLNLEPSSASAMLKRYAQQYAGEFNDGQPISRSIRPVVKDRRPPMSELATQTLALAGNYPGLVDALSAPHEESRLAAIIGLRSWLPLSPEHGGELQLELQNRYRPAEADAIYRLLWGFSEEDARDPIVSEDLVNWLGSEEIAIRELAYFHVFRLTDRRFDYRPNDPAPQRAAALERWHRYVSDQGALIGN